LAEDVAVTLLTPDSVRAGMAIHELVVEAYDEGKRDRRAEIRYPFFRAVGLQVDGQRVSAFSREISPSGIGLLHNMELPPTEVEVTVPSRRGHSVRMRVRIVWCRPCGEGWYISGGRLVDVVGIGA
jgi:hypothetical protein